MTYMDDQLNVKSSMRSGILNGLKRKLFTSHSLLFTEYYANTQGGEVAISSHLPGNIMPISIKPNESFIIANKSLLCYTKNLELNTKFRLKGLYVKEGIAQTEIINKSNSKGMFWLSSYGSYFKKNVKEGEGFKLANGLFFYVLEQMLITKYQE